MKSAFALATALLATAAATPAFAEGSAPAASIESPTTAARPFTLGAQLELLPAGSWTMKISDRDGGNVRGEDDGDMKTAFGIGATFAYDVASNVSLGLAPRLVFGAGADVPNAPSMNE